MLWQRISTNIFVIIPVFMYALCNASHASAQNIIHVPADYPAIQEAIDAATDGDEIIVAPGTYNEMINFNGKAIHLRSSGGASETILDAEGAGTVVTCSGNEGPDTILEGFTITGGNAPSGGGMFIEHSSPTVIDCIFTDNVASVGGGMFNGFSNMTVIDTVFVNNTADLGGGMVNVLSTVTVTSCAFESNIAFDSGGGMFNNIGATAQISGTTFCANLPNHIDGSWDDLGENMFASVCPQCAGHCGEQAPGGCWCDEACLENGDCCSDVCTSCSETCPEQIFVPDDLPTIQAAVDFAGDGVEIIVGPGTYNEAINFLGKAIHLRSSDGPEETIIDASGLETSVVTSASGEGPDTILEGFIITGGTVGTPWPPNPGLLSGGGMFIRHSNPTIVNCIFSDNSTSHRGGGMFIDAGSPVITDCVFASNSAGSGGGMYIIGDSQPQITVCLFEGNSAQHGAGLQSDESSAIITETVFLNNTATSQGGGMRNINESEPTLENCTFASNSASVGGGMYNSLSYPVVLDSAFVGNTASIVGGGMYQVSSSAPLIIHCRFESNTAGDDGGAIYTSDTTSVPAIEQTNFCANAPSTITGPWDDLGGNVFVDVSCNQSCLGECGGQSAAGCWCDAGCWDRGDCCYDACSQCDVHCDELVIEVPKNFSGIQQAIDYAQDGAEIVVSPGTYNEAINFLGKSLHLRSSDGPDVTIIDASGRGASAVRIAGGVGPETILEGFTITGGTGSTVSPQYPQFPPWFVIGGGLLINGSSPTIDNCILIGNAADVGGGIAALGASASPLITGCTLTENAAEESGGGMYNLNSSPTVQDCIFEGNWADFSGGGGMSNNESSVVTVTDCVFIGNSAVNSSLYGGGGIANRGSSTTAVSGSMFKANNGHVGGGIANSGVASISITDSVLENNNAAFFGGGILNREHGHVTILDSVLEENSSAVFTVPLGPNEKPTAEIGSTRFCANFGGQFVDQGDIVGQWTDLGDNLFTVFACDESCIISCGGQAPSGCWCDADCFDRGDCCGDYCTNCDLTCEQTIYVPDDVSSIQMAVHWVADGGEIVVAPGLYEQRVNITNKEIYLRSSHGPEQTILAAPSGGSVIRINAVYDQYITIDGFAITGGSAQFGGGINAVGGNPTIIDCVVEDNQASHSGGGLAVRADNPAVIGCVVKNNTADVFILSEVGGGMYMECSGSALMMDNTFIGNSAPHYGGGAYFAISAEGDVLMSGNTFADNFAPDGPGLTIAPLHASIGTMNAIGELGDGVLNVGELRPGDSEPGYAIVNGDYSQRISSTTGTLIIDLGGRELGAQHSVLDVNGTASIGGRLAVSLIDEFLPSSGDSFPVLTAQSIESVFDVAVLPSMPTGLVMRVNYQHNAAAATGASVTLTVEELATLLGFGDPSLVGLDSVATSVATGDFNQDGHLDIALTLRGETPSDPGSVLILFNDGAGESYSGAQYAVGSEPSDLAVADLTGEGRLDIVVTNGADNTVSVLLNDGFDDFTAAPSIPVGIAPSAIVAADLRGIGVMDLAVTNAGEDSVHILHNTGASDGTFDNVQSIAVGPTPSDIIAADLMQNGSLDLAVTNRDADPNPDEGDPEPAVMILGNDGSGSFSIENELIGGLGTNQLDAEDLDNNKDLDLIAINADSGDMSIFKNLGTGNFGSALNVPLNGSPQSMAVWDMDGDGTSDLAIVVDDPESGLVVRILRNDTVPGTGTLVFSFADDLGEGDNPILVTSGDVTGDGAEDLITVNAGDEDGGGGGAASGGTGAQSSVAIHPNQSGVPGIPGDLNGDGVVDEQDLVIVLDNWGPCADCNDCIADITETCTVNVDDLLFILNNWG